MAHSSGEMLPCELRHKRRNGVCWFYGKCNCESTGIHQDMGHFERVHWVGVCEYGLCSSEKLSCQLQEGERERHPCEFLLCIFLLLHTQHTQSQAELLYRTKSQTLRTSVGNLVCVCDAARCLDPFVFRLFIYRCGSNAFILGTPG